MKHKLTVLACVGLALLLSTGLAFAQPNNTITIESKNVNRCSNATVGINLINGDEINGIGLPLKVTGGTVSAAAATARLAGFTLAQNGVPGANFLLNAVGGSLAAGAGNIYTLTVPISSACTGTVDIDTAFFAPAGVVILLSGCCPVDYAFNKGVLTLDDQQPVCGDNPNVTLDWQSAIVDKLLMATDPDACDGLVYSLVSSPGSIAPGTNKYSWDPGCPEVVTSPHTITFKATDPCGEFATCSFQVTVTQQGPVCATVPAQTIHWLGTLSILLPATDDGCPGALGWTLNTVVPPVAGTLSINPTTGRLTFSPKCADIATSPHVVTYTVSDGVKTCQSTVSITVTNTDPTLVCPSPIDPAHLCNNQLIDGGDGIFNIGDLVTGTAVGADINGDPLTYSVVSITKNGDPGAVPHNAPTIGLTTGAFSWLTSAALPSEVGTWTIVLAVSDGCATVTCSFTVTLEFTFYVGITNAAGTSDQIHALNGQVACVYITIGPDYPLGGLDLLLAYDVTAIAFLQPAVAMGDLAEWEYFTYRTGVDGNCDGGGCPTGMIRIIAIADLDNGPLIHPLASEFGLEGQVVKLCFTVTADRNFIGQCIPISWYTVDCGDNVLSSKDGYTTFVEIGTDTAACAVNEKPGHFLIPIVHFCDGWICIDEPPDDRGDINLDGVANSIADAVLFSRYFIYGIGEFETDPALRAVQVLATDINDDGVVLTVADLVYLVRIITGDASPFPAGENPKLTPYQNHADAVVNVGANRVSVTTNSAVDLGGAVFTFRYSGLTVGDAVLGNAASQMVVKSNADRGELRVLVAPPMDAKGARINAGINEIVSIPTTGEGTIELVSVEIADAQGALLSTNLSRGVPSEYALLQNYPNPFNAGTVIQFSLKDQADWKLNVYNITGQTVRSFSGNGAGQVQVAWDGNDKTGNAIASGVYFYRLETKAFTATKKMTLMK
jgi:hypothetical protein